MLCLIFEVLLVYSQVGLDKGLWESDFNILLASLDIAIVSCQYSLQKK